MLGQNNFGSKIPITFIFFSSDSSKEGAEDLFIQTVSNDGFEKYKSGRFLYLNAWRNISGKYVLKNARILV